MFPNSTLGQSSVNKKAKSNFNAPDTDSRLVKNLSGSTSINPNFMHDHTRYEYIVPSGNAGAVVVNTPINTEDRSLYWIVLDNSNNSSLNKTFTFSSTYVFLDDAGNTTNTYVLNANKKLVWFGTFTDGKLQLRIASESTN
jgi:hypothetical protein